MNLTIRPISQQHQVKRKSIWDSTFAWLKPVKMSFYDRNKQQERSSLKPVCISCIRHQTRFVSLSHWSPGTDVSTSAVMRSKTRKLNIYVLLLINWWKKTILTISVEQLLELKELKIVLESIQIFWNVCMLYK